MRVTKTVVGPVEVFWGRASDPALLRRAVAAALEVPVGEVHEHRVCPRCGSSGHGRPLVRVTGRPAPHVSLSRHDVHAVVAVCLGAPVGVDVDVASEPAWVRREAVGKALGRGITEELAEPGPAWVTITAPPGTTAVVAVDHPDEPVVVTRAGPAASDR